MPTFGEQLVAARRARHMTQETLSQTINVARNTISSWERGRTLPDAASLHLLSDVLGYEFVLTPGQAASATPATSENPATPVIPATPATLATPAIPATPATPATGEETIATSSTPSDDEEPAATPSTLSVAEETAASDDDEPAATPSTDSAQFIAPGQGVEDQSKPDAPSRSKLPWIIAGVAVLVCIVIAVVLVHKHQTPTEGIPAAEGVPLAETATADEGAPAAETSSPSDSQPVVDEDAHAFNEVLYQTSVANDPAKAYIAFDNNKTWVESNDGSEYQMYSIGLVEKNGIAFSISRIDIELEADDGHTKTMSAGVETLEKAIETDMPAYGTADVVGGFPKGNFVRGGISVYGTDANGESLTFYSLMEFAP